MQIVAKHRSIAAAMGWREWEARDRPEMESQDSQPWAPPPSQGTDWGEEGFDCREVGRVWGQVDSQPEKESMIHSLNLEKND